jgi:hypothetical protein
LGMDVGLAKKLWEISETLVKLTPEERQYWRWLINLKENMTQRMIPMCCRPIYYYSIITVVDVGLLWKKNSKSFVISTHHHSSTHLQFRLNLDL